MSNMSEDWNELRRLHDELEAAEKPTARITSSLIIPPERAEALTRMMLGLTEGQKMPTPADCQMGSHTFSVAQDVGCIFCGAGKE